MKTVQMYAWLVDIENIYKSMRTSFAAQSFLYQMIKALRTVIKDTNMLSRAVGLKTVECWLSDDAMFR